MGAVIVLGIVFVLVCFIPLLIIAIRSIDPKNRVDIPTVKPTVIEQHIEVRQDTIPEHPTIAEQYDSRLTNIFKNPLEGIL